MPKILAKKTKKNLETITPKNLHRLDFFDLAIDRLFGVVVDTAINESVTAIHFEFQKNGGNIRFRHQGKLRIVYAFDRVRFLELLNYVVNYFDFESQHKLPQLSRLVYQQDGRQYYLNASWIKLSQTESRLVININHNLDKKITDLPVNNFTKAVLDKYLKKNLAATIVTCKQVEKRKDYLFSLALSNLSENEKAVSIEYYVSKNVTKIEQLQIRPEIGFTCDTALRAVMAQDFDVIIIDELKTTAELDFALHLALAGKKVFIGMIFDGLNDVFRFVRHQNIDLDLWFLVVGGVLVVREIEKVCQKCRQVINIDSQAKDLIQPEINNLPVKAKIVFAKLISSEWHFVEGVGCVSCQNSGLTGLTDLVEFAQINKKFKNGLINKTGQYRLIDLIDDTTLVSLRQDALIKALSGELAFNNILKLDRYI
ncbi:MAG: ATPase, T2SS/T4P/T4SS family [bacterium]